ncbi:MAG: membrane protein insertase YidC [Cyclobacteriaceae bacterium]
MDKNQYIGLILMFGLLAVYFVYFAPDPPHVVEEPVAEQAGPATPITPETSITQQAVPDAERSRTDSLKYGIFSFAAGSDAQEKIIETDELKIVFSNKGGRIREVYLKKHKDYLGDPVQLMNGEKSAIHLQVDHQGKRINLSELSFTASSSSVNDTTILNYTLSNGSFNLIQTYSIPSKGFQIGYNVKSTGLNNVIDPTDINLLFNHGITRAESNLEDGRFNSNVRYYTSGGDYDELSERSNDFEEETIAEPLKWISFKQKFFTIGLIANSSFKSGYATTIADLGDTTIVKNAYVQLAIPYTDFLNGFSYRYYFGPNNYTVLKKVTDEFEENLDMGWGPLPLVNKYLIIPIFHFLEKYIGNYGIIILIIVFIIRLMLSPLTYKSHMSMAKMRVMKPEIDEIKEKHDGNMQKAQQEQMALYQKVGVNPLSGCIPMLLQMPVLFALFFFFPNAVELRQQSFLWAHDLSTYDSIVNLPFTIPFYGDHVSLFTLLMTVSTILITASNSQMTTIQGPMKTLQYMMPIMFLFVLNSYASGLTFYYFVSNMLTFGQTVLFRKLIDEDTIKAALEENRKNSGNKKKSKFQSRLEEAMKASQEAQRAKKKKK